MNANGEIETKESLYPGLTVTLESLIPSIAMSAKVSCLVQKQSSKYKRTNRRGNEVWSTPSRKRHKSCSEKKPLSEHPDQYKHLSRGDLIWGLLGRRRWWPAVVIAGEDTGFCVAKRDHILVFWFADYKISELPIAKIVPFMKYYHEKHLNLKNLTKYNIAVEEAIEEHDRQVSILERQNEDTAKSARTGEPTDGGRELERENAMTNVNSVYGDLVDSNSVSGGHALSGWIEDILKVLRKRFHPESATNFKKKSADTAVSSQSTVVKSSSNPRTLSAKDHQEELTDVAPVNALLLVTGIDANNNSKAQGSAAVMNLCIACGTDDVSKLTEHPLFYGEICHHCKNQFVESIFCFNPDGTNVFCMICGAGGRLLVCANTGCKKVYCCGCVERLVGKDTVTYIKDCLQWSCYLCASVSPSRYRDVGSLIARTDWRDRLALLFQPRPVQQVPAVPCCGIRVLSLFDGIGSGLIALQRLGMQVDAYYSCEINPHCNEVTSRQHCEIMTQLGCVTNITTSMLKGMGPIDLILGSLPCSDFAVNPGFEDSSEEMLYEYVRILLFARMLNGDRPLWFLYENGIKTFEPLNGRISRFLECRPIRINARDFSAMDRARYFWGNLPNMYCPAQDRMNDKPSNGGILFRSRTAHGEVQTDEHILDTLWASQIEKLFGFPEHYTDVGNLTIAARKKLLGGSSSVPIVMHLLSPLRRFFLPADPI